jgi:hypothetical protein
MFEETLKRPNANEILLHLMKYGPEHLSDIMTMEDHKPSSNEESLTHQQQRVKEMNNSLMYQDSMLEGYGLDPSTSQHEQIKTEVPALPKQSNTLAPMTKGK